MKRKDFIERNSLEDHWGVSCPISMIYLPSRLRYWLTAIFSIQQQCHRRRKTGIIYSCVPILLTCLSSSIQYKPRFFNFLKYVCYFKKKIPFPPSLPFTHTDVHPYGMFTHIGHLQIWEVHPNGTYSYGRTSIDRIATKSMSLFCILWRLILAHWDYSECYGGVYVVSIRVTLYHI